MTVKITMGPTSLDCFEGRKVNTAKVENSDI